MYNDTLKKNIQNFQHLKSNLYKKKKIINYLKNYYMIKAIN